MDGAAQLIPLTRWDIHGLPGTVAQVHTVLPPTGSPIVARGHDLVIFHDDSAVTPAQAGRPFEHGLGNVQIIIFLIDALHTRSPCPLFGW